jgi:hypothetical protein
MAHTPGPWTLIRGFVTAADGLLLHSGNRPHDEVVANAKLIAAAPDLLAACEEFIHQHEGNRVPEQMYLIMKAAVYKATK